MAINEKIINLNSISTYLNKYYSYHKIKNLDPLDIVNLSHQVLSELEEKVLLNSKVTLRAIKSEMDKTLINYKSLSVELSDIVNKLTSGLKSRPHLSSQDLNHLEELEIKRNILAEFIYSIEDVLFNYLDFLFNYFSEDEIGLDFIGNYKEFLPKWHKLHKVSQIHVLKSYPEKLRLLNNELSEFESLDEKLNYWKKHYFDKFENSAVYTDLAGKTYDTRPNEYAKSNISTLVFQYFGNIKCTSPALIPSQIYSLHFEDGLKDVSFTRWFLKFNAEQLSKEYYEAKFRKKLGNKLSNKLIKKELLELEEFELEADKLLLQGKIDPYDQNINHSFRAFAELKRLECDYYKSNILESPHLKSSGFAVDMFAKHIFFKNWLIDQLGNDNTDSIDYDSLDNKFVQHMLSGLESMSRKPRKFHDENDYRAYFYDLFNFLDGVLATSEEESKKGRTDLIVRGEFGTRIIEFKIWGRNDYKEIVKQTYDYLTDFQSKGYIIMVNKNKQKEIDKEYLKIMRNDRFKLKSSIAEVNDSKSDFKYYISQHKIGVKEKEITHFIINEN